MKKKIRPHKRPLVLKKKIRPGERARTSLHWGICCDCEGAYAECEAKAEASNDDTFADNVKGVLNFC